MESKLNQSTHECWTKCWNFRYFGNKVKAENFERRSKFRVQQGEILMQKEPMLGTSTLKRSKGRDPWATRPRSRNSLNRKGRHFVNYRHHTAQHLSSCCHHKDSSKTHWPKVGPIHHMSSWHYMAQVGNLTNNRHDHFGFHHRISLDPSEDCLRKLLSMNHWPKDEPNHRKNSLNRMVRSCMSMSNRHGRFYCHHRISLDPFEDCLRKLLSMNHWSKDEPNHRKNSLNRMVRSCMSMSNRHGRFYCHHRISLSYYDPIAA